MEDVYGNCEIVSWDEISNNSYNIDFENEMDFAELWDVPFSLDRATDGCRY